MSAATLANEPARRPWAVWLIGLYIVLLLALPVDIGLNVAGSVLTPARIALGMAVVVALLDWRSVLAAVRRVPRLIWIGWAAFLLAALVTAFIWPSAASWVRYGSLVVEGLVVFVLVFHAAIEPGGVRTLARVFAVAIVVVAAVVLALALAGLHYDKVVSGIAGTVPAADVSERYGLERQAGPFRGALYFGIWMVAASALLLPAMASAKPRIRWLALAAWLLLVVSVFFLTASRLAATAIFVAPGIYFLARGPRRVGVASLVVALAVAVGLGALIPANPAVQHSNELRVAALNPALQAILAHPLFGSGLLSDLSVLTGIIGKKNYVDDSYLSLAIEIGLVGLGAFLLLVGSIVLATRRAWHSALGLALAIGVVGVLAMAVLASLFTASQGYSAFFVLAALAVAVASRPYSATSGADLASQL
jgi:hypothetical protein